MFNQHWNRRDILRLAGLSGAYTLSKGSAALELSHSSSFESDLEQLFRNPPLSTRSRCYWYWMDGHISLEGITKDLEAMKRIGIGEPYIGVIGGGQSGAPDGEVKALTEEFWQAIEHAIREAGRLGLDIGLFNSPGWSQSGGPWIKESQSMRYLSAKEVSVAGPQRFSAALPVPEGEFQDIRVLAFPAPAFDDDSLQRHMPIITGDHHSTFTYEVEKPFTARSLRIVLAEKATVTGELLVSQDGKSFDSVRKFLVDRHNLGEGSGPIPLAPITVSFPATTGRVFRLQFSSACNFSDIVISAAARVENLSEKLLEKVFQDPHPPADFYMWPTSSEPDSKVFCVSMNDVRDISAHMTPGGVLIWDVPAGSWILQRVFALPTGAKNTPASPEATGLEVDKMSRTALQTHYEAYVGHILTRMPAADRRALKHVVADSYETGPQNWTDDLIKDFTVRYGYDPVGFLPVLGGRLVGSSDQSDRFLWDLRRMIADRIATDYVGGLRDLAHQSGLRLWLENYGHWGFPSEFLKYGGNSDEIAGEFWAGSDFDNTLELRAASSAAHTYGQPVVWAEAFTGGPAFQHSPRDLKLLGDWALCQGVNQFVLHVYIHQPWENKVPGVNAWFGTEFNRHNTWFEMARPWVDYQRRCSVLLQTGVSVADIAYFIGEDAPKMTGSMKPDLPVGFDFDFINAEVIERYLQVQDGRFVLPDGTSYRILVLPPQETMRPELLRKLRDLVYSGGTVVGPPPGRSPSNHNYPYCDAEVQRLSDDLWSGRSTGLGRVFHETRMVQILQQLQLQADVICGPAILWKHRREGDTDIYFIANQRQIGRVEHFSFRVADRAPDLWSPETGDIEPVVDYSLVGRRVELSLHLEPAGSIFVVFRRQATKVQTRPSHSHLSALEIRQASYRSEDGSASFDVTTQLRQAISRDQLCLLVSNETLGNDPAPKRRKQLQVDYTEHGQSHTKISAEYEWCALGAGYQITGPWQVTFHSHPVNSKFVLVFDSLQDWSKHDNAEVRYYSGLATYRTSFEIPEVGDSIQLNLGMLHDLATVRLNGQPLGTVWRPPYGVDISSAARKGTNALEIEVCNCWLNRLIGDEQVGSASTTSVTHKGWNATTPLLPAGLLGPVTISRNAT